MKMNKLSFIVLLGVMPFFWGGSVLWGGQSAGGAPQGQNITTTFSGGASTQKSLRRFELYREGRELEKKWLFEAAIVKYKAMTDPALLNFDYDAGMGLGAIMDVHIKQGEFEQALQELQWFLVRNQKKYQDEKFEIESLIEARKSGNSESIRSHIKYLEDKHKDILPPKAVIAGASDFVATAIFRLYDHIADYDDGMAFAEEFLKFYAKIGPGNPYQPANVFFQIKQAFEQDKKDGRPSCITAKPGEVCMGRATKALIQSDYFSW